MIEINGDKVDLKEALECLAYRILKNENPNWHSIPEEMVCDLLNEEPGVHAEVVYDRS